ncbi:hypothetical protein A4X06_0g6595 [Tilletia controversa]|uniref:Uncharacterized protein n=2 Tax=Tilletia TaxID=13289 RepID=A0A8X7MNQ3_9BASI|nr:hypothetical protein CF336_g6075 [Tilletia laevis]KAE8191800.1 hypothetical protein CF328_g5567 [Tilletia controversa]KAE8243031.1 hypothetical protein A4X06_0g6595 [Tilletia controversa]KAE8255528.1 hypothetical protein A4X03_0g5550 [Tilletia caries]
MSASTCALCECAFRISTVNRASRRFCITDHPPPVPPKPACITTGERLISRSAETGSSSASALFPDVLEGITAEETATFRPGSTAILRCPRYVEEVRLASSVDGGLGGDEAMSSTTAKKRRQFAPDQLPLQLARAAMHLHSDASHLLESQRHVLAESLSSAPSLHRRLRRQLRVVASGGKLMQLSASTPLPGHVIISFDLRPTPRSGRDATKGQGEGREQTTKQPPPAAPPAYGHVCSILRTRCDAFEIRRGSIIKMLHAAL